MSLNFINSIPAPIFTPLGSIHFSIHWDYLLLPSHSIPWEVIWKWADHYVPKPTDIFKTWIHLELFLSHLLWLLCCHCRLGLQICVFGRILLCWSHPPTADLSQSMSLLRLLLHCNCQLPSPILILYYLFHISFPVKLFFLPLGLSLYCYLFYGSYCNVYWRSLHLSSPNKL